MKCLRPPRPRIERHPVELPATAYARGPHNSNDALQLPGLAKSGRTLSANFSTVAALARGTDDPRTPMHACRSCKSSPQLPLEALNRSPRSLNSIVHALGKTEGVNEDGSRNELILGHVVREEKRKSQTRPHPSRIPWIASALVCQATRARLLPFQTVPGRGTNGPPAAEVQVALLLSKIRLSSVQVEPRARARTKAKSSTLRSTNGPSGPQELGWRYMVPPPQKYKWSFCFPKPQLIGSSGTVKLRTLKYLRKRRKCPTCTS